ncbi:MAG TPA: 3-methyl-2-oxobutanoate hydroxymethyltransferase [Pseudomonas pachastrellae]|nr:3-methyl-2-oxobutanoate hydroxymethyltransferase [Halopseudomonas pachastrellae]
MTHIESPHTRPCPQESNPPYGGASATADQPRRKVTVRRLTEMRASGEKIAVLTAYDASMAAVADAAGIDCLIVGDSIGMVCQGLSSTTAVTLDDMCYHTRCVSQGIARVNGCALIIADLPFGSYNQSKEQAIGAATQLIKAGAHMVKLEGGGWTVELVEALVERGIPVCAHLGLTPQTVSALGGYRVQGRTDTEAQQLCRDALALEQAGASLLVLEMVPAELSRTITASLQHCATIGIGAGQATHGQVLVMHDMLGINLGKMAKFVRNFLLDAPDVQGAFASYVQAVKGQRFPIDSEHAW